jgi:hypothetical protein
MAHPKWLHEGNANAKAVRLHSEDVRGLVIAVATKLVHRSRIFDDLEVVSAELHVRAPWTVIGTNGWLM